MNREKLLALKNNRYAQIAAICLVLILVYKFYIWICTETTDNAYVASDITIISSEVTGSVTKVLCHENGAVRAGEVLMEIDSTEYVASLNKAIFAVTAAERGVDANAQKIEIAKLNVSQAEESVKFAQENYDSLLKDYKRTSELARSDYSTAKLLDSAKISLEKAALDLAQATTDLALAQKNQTLLETQQSIDESNLLGLREAQKTAVYLLSKTHVIAPIDGVATNTTARVGNLMQPGQIIAAIVPVDRLYITANFKETQITKFKDGMRAYIEFDSVPGVKVKGFVRNIAPASGSNFSLIPPDNAIGNFTKVVQRFPVIIDFKVPDNLRGIIKTGMSVIVSIKK